MPTKCKNYTDAISTIEYHKRRGDRFYDDDMHMNEEDQNVMRGILGKLTKMIARKAAGKQSSVKEAEVNKGIDELYGERTPRLHMLVKLQSIMKANPGIQEAIDKFLIESITRMQTKGKIQWVVKRKQRILDWSTISLPVLRSAVNYAQELVAQGAGENLGKGFIGRLVVQLTTARKLAAKEVTGALFRMRQAVRDFPMQQGRLLKKFTDADISVKGGRNYGMDHILQGIGRLALHTSLKGTATPNTEIIITAMFQSYLSRDQDGKRALRINDDGSMDMANAWQKRRNSEGKVVFYRETNEPIYEYADYRPVKDFFGPETIEFNEDMRKKFLYEAGRYDKLHEELWEFMQKEFGQTQKKLFKLLKTLVPANYTDEDIKALFFERDPTLFGKRRKDGKSWADLNEKQQSIVKRIHENASKYLMFKPFVFEGTEIGVEEMKGRASFPIIYNKMKFPFLFDDFIARLQRDKKELDLELSNPELDLATRNKLNPKLKETVSKLKRANDLLNKMDDMPVDMGSGVRLMLGADTKHAKHITNAFNVLEGRKDKGAYYAYLKHNFSQLERAKLAIELIESLKMAKSDAVEDILMNWYKVSMYQPDAKSGLGPIDFSSEGVSTALGNGIFGIEKTKIHVSAAKIDARMRTILSYFGGNLLKGWGTALQNYTAVAEKFFISGAKAVYDAIKIIERGGKDLERIIALSGVVDFREFFSRSLTNDALILGAENKQIMAMAGEMVRYWTKVEKMQKLNLSKKQQADKRAEYKKELEELLGRTIDTIPNKERIKRRKSNLWDQHRNNLMRKYVDYAINKEYEAAPYVQSVHGQAIGSAVELWAEFQRTHGPTMGKTEATLRTLSFVIGVRKAMIMEVIPLQELSELEGDNLDKAIEIGRNYVELMDFGLSRQDLGTIGHSNIGAFFTEFKVWSMQKFAADLDKIKLGLSEVKDPDIKGIDIGGIGKLIDLAISYRKVPTDVLRTTHPRVAAFRSWFATQGLWTAIWDMLIMGPLVVVKLAAYIPLARFLPMSNPLFRTVGGSTSDLISLMLSPLTIAIFLSAGEGDDPWEKITDYFLRKSIVGFGGKWLIDSFLTVVSLFMDADEDEHAQRVIKTATPVLPPIVKEVVKPTYELLLKD